MAIGDLRREKARIRKEAREAIGRMTRTERRRFSSLIADRLVSLPSWSRGVDILMFSSIAGEVETSNLITFARREGKAVFLPRISWNEMHFHLFAPMDLERNSYGVMEPSAKARRWSVGAARHPRRALIICPGLAFDQEGMRLGRGEGYYDRFLERIRRSGADGVAIIGICFDVQTIALVPTATRDQRMDAVVTESRIILPSP